MNRILLLAGLVMALMLCGCQKSPDSGAVISRNDGAFDANVIVSAGQHHDPEATQAARYSNRFSSTDGSVEFRFTIDESVTAADMPVLEAVPHFLTVDDARRVGQVLFDNSVFYEFEPAFVENYSKDEIQEKINRWAPYTSSVAVRTLFGYEPASDICGTVKSFIERYTQLYETAPKENPHEICRWEFRKTGEYMQTEEERSERDLSKDNDEINAVVRHNGYPYILMIANRDKSDFKINIITACFYDGLDPAYINESIFMAELCRTEKPTEEKLESIRSRAAEMLKQMELGTWEIDECYVETTYKGEIPEYVVCVNAVPVLNGVAVVRQPQLESLRGENAYSAAYYYTDVNFRFSANGDLLFFSMYSPLEIRETLNPNVAVMSLDELMENAQQYFQNTDAYAYGFAPYYSMVEEDVQCIVTVTNLAYNLVRVKVPQTEANYYYVPGIVLSGAVEYIGKETGNLYFSAENTTLISLNGVDGSRVS